MISRSCSTCKIGKPLSNFRPDPYSPTGHKYQCRACENESTRRRREKRKANAGQISEAVHELALAEAENEDGRRTKVVSLAVARDELFLQRFDELAKKRFAGKIAASGYARKRPRGQGKRILNVLLSDLHFGTRHDGRELPQSYGAAETARRLAKVIAEAAEYKPQYREHTSLKVRLSGDILQGALGHGPTWDTALAAQFDEALWLLTQALAFLAKHFPSVEVYIQNGNHDRDISVHPKRATSQKWNGWTWCLGRALHYACSGLSNVEIFTPRTPYCAIQLFDAWEFATHGDTVFSIGNPGQKLDVAAIENKAHKINSTGVYGHRFQVFSVGHVHVSASLELSGDAALIVNSALVPMDGYSESLGYVTACSQWLWESVPGYPVGDQRRIKVGPGEDGDASLDKIIRPYDEAA